MDNNTRDSHTEMRPGFIHMVRQSLKNLGLQRSIAYFFLMRDEQRRFVKAGKDEQDRDRRARMIKQFSHIYNNVLCLHFPLHFVFVAKFMLDLRVEGPIVECGSYRGGSSAQLSIIARETGRRLYVCDSFQGLPKPQEGEGVVSIFNDSRVHEFKEGDYSATLEEVKANIARYGHPDLCEYVPGFFSDSLPGLDIAPAALMIDVDLVSSALDCLKYLWPRLRPGGLVFTHEAESDSFMRGIMDPDWWGEELGQCPPMIMGAGSSLSPVAEGLAVIFKPEG